MNCVATEVATIKTVTGLRHLRFTTSFVRSFLFALYGA